MTTSNAWMRARILALTGLAFAAAQSASAAFIMSEFAADDEGWTSNVDAEQTSEPRAGNDTGYLLISGNGAITPEAWAASKFLGDKSFAIGGEFSFLANVVDPPLAHSLTTYTASLTLISGGDSVTVNFEPRRDLVRTWGEYSVELTASAWGLTNGQFSAIMSNLTDIRLAVTSSTGAPVDLGFDNIAMTPTPGAAALMLIAGPALLRRRR